MGYSKDSGHKYEYEHYDLGYGMHFGRHSIFGPHLAIGRGRDMVHIYPYKVFIGGESVPLSPEQQRVVLSVFGAVERRISATRVAPVLKTSDPPPGVKDDADSGRVPE